MFKHPSFIKTTYKTKELGGLICLNCGYRFGNHFILSCTHSPKKGYPRKLIEKKLLNV